MIFDLIFYSDLLYFSLFIIGSCMGSFIYVAFTRFSIDKSVAEYLYDLTFSRSCCSLCSKQLRYWQLIPLFSWIGLKGRCYFCNGKILLTYFVIEIIVGLLFLFIGLDKGLTGRSLLLLTLLCWFLVMAMIDYYHYLLLDFFTQPLMWFGVILAYFALGFISLESSLIGILMGYLLLKVPSVVYFCVTKKEGLGGGDIKLLAALGAWIDYSKLPILLIIASILAIVYSVIRNRFFYKKRVTVIPFGPFILFSAYGMIYFC